MRMELFAFVLRHGNFTAEVDVLGNTDEHAAAEVARVRQCSDG